ncbi:hypothetical protein [Candidatus Neomicrothrix sp.]|uniref:hypothetical protein n=1 Tax=Candidatus Neomicrothrix sp. TaxID=2719034 RepID=UPI00259754DC|nr:hypothetical protein [Candidatus Microthrix sp.]HMS49205.1 hypothetical protein [Candidatus Microthrix sp.]
MGTIGGLVVPLVVAAAIGFVVGWFFARAGRGPDGVAQGRSDADGAEPGSDDVDERVARLEADYARRVEVFSKREAELITAGRKVVEQLRQREGELAEVRDEGASDGQPPTPLPSAPGRQEPEPSTAEPTRRNERPVGPSTEPAEPAEPRTPPTSSPPATAETPAASGSTGAAPAVSGLARAAPAPAKRGRRAVIDPATGQPINPESKPKPSSGDDPVGSAHSNGGQSRPPGPEADVPDAGSSAELSVRLIAPGLTREEPEVIDLRDQRRVPPAADIVPPASRQGEELIDIVGIGPKIADQLRQAGVVTLADLAGLDLDGPLPTSIEGLRGRLRQGDWVGQARRLTD